MLLLPVALNDFVSRGFSLTRKQRGEFVNALAAVERGNQRLHYGHRAIAGAGIAP